MRGGKTNDAQRHNLMIVNTKQPAITYMLIAFTGLPYWMFSLSDIICGGAQIGFGRTDD